MDMSTHSSDDWPNSLDGVMTPALVLDRDRLKANIKRMGDAVAGLGVALRPHLKTAKCADVARLIFSGEVGPITVSTLHEADYFLGHGFTDVLYAVGIAPAKLDMVADLIDRGQDLKIITDNVTAAKAIADHAAISKTKFRVLIEIECGDHRGGIDPDDPALLDIAHALTYDPHVELAGVMTHAGHSYDCRSTDEMADVAEAERRAAVGAAERLRAAGYPTPIVSVGSTPTALYARHLDGVTETRAGVYMFSDLFQAGIGTSTLDDLAVSVISTVIGHKEKDNVLLIDAGGLALSKDRSGASLVDDPQYGLVCEPRSCHIMDDLIVAAVNQEHGRVTTKSGAPVPFEHLPVGAKVRVLPNHVCMMAAAYDAYYVTDGDDQIHDRWMRCNGW